MNQKRKVQSLKRLNKSLEVRRHSLKVVIRWDVVVLTLGEGYIYVLYVRTRVRAQERDEVETS